MSDASVRALEAYVRLTNTAAISHIVRASLETGVVDALRDSQKTLPEIAERTQFPTQRLQLLLEALTAIGVIEQYGDTYALAQVGHLVPVELADLGDRYWRHLNRWIVEGMSIPENDESNLDEFDYLRERHASEWLQTPAAMFLAKFLGFGDQRKGLHLLDIGCGSAVLSLTAAFQDPTCRVTAFDQPFGLERAREMVESIQLGDRIKLVEDTSGSFELPAGEFDMAVLGNVLHYLPADKVESLIQRAAQVIKPGGELVVVDVFPGQAKGTLNRTLFELQLALRYPEGEMHTRESLTQWIEAAGFEPPIFEPLDAPPWLFGVLVAKRPTAK